MIKEAKERHDGVPRLHVLQAGSVTFRVRGVHVQFARLYDEYVLIWVSYLKNKDKKAQS